MFELPDSSRSSKIIRLAFQPRTTPKLVMTHVKRNYARNHAGCSIPLRGWKGRGKVLEKGAKQTELTESGLGKKRARQEKVRLQVEDWRQVRDL